MKKVAVFSASARPGTAQVQQLKKQGYAVRAVSRRTIPAFEGCEVVAADLNDPASLERACEGIDAVLFTSPTFSDRTRGAEHAYALGTAALKAGVKQLVYNTTSWHPEELIGVPTMDEHFRRTQALRDSGVPLTVVRPSLFMDNLLTKWVTPDLLGDSVLKYPHREDLQVSWICLDDVAAVMVAVLGKPDFIGRTIDIGGPDDLTPPEVCKMLSAKFGRDIRYERISPREFGERLYAVFGDVAGQDKEEYITDFEKHYLYKNVHNPFQVDTTEIGRALGVTFTPMRDWIARQDWADATANVGSVSG